MCSMVVGFDLSLKTGPDQSTDATCLRSEAGNAVTAVEAAELQSDDMTVPLSLVLECSPRTVASRP